MQHHYRSRWLWAGMLLAAISLAGCGSQGQSSAASTSSSIHAALPSQTATQSPQEQGQTMTIYVLRGEPYGVVGPDHKHHDTIAPANLVLRQGVPVTLTIINYDEGAHTITAPDLGLNIQIQPGQQQSNDTVKPVTTTYRFTPTKTGDFRWYCTLPCDKGGGYWAMTSGYDGPDQDGFMAGYFIVIPNGSQAL